MSKQLYSLIQNDIDAIALAKQNSKVSGDKIWDDTCLADFKRRLKDHVRIQLGEQCCYCCKPTNDEFNMVLDIEHVLPKSKYPRLEFEPFNLSVACKRCNMEIKKEDDSFISNAPLTKPKAQVGTNYQLIHPNYEDYSDHLLFIVSIVGPDKLIKYVAIPGSTKGPYTYDYFKLDLIETNSMNNAQGNHKPVSDLSKHIPDNLKNDISQILGL